MELRISENQLKSLIKQTLKSKELGEQEEPVNPEPEAGTSDKQTGGSGYPAVGKWESGITRGPANQIGVTKWSDVVGANLKRGKANQLKEQSSYERAIWNKSTQTLNKISKVDAHDVLGVLELGTLFIPVVGPFISAGFGLGNAALYYKEGDTKSAGLFALFSVLPFVGDIPVVKQLGKKGMDLLGQKLIKQGTKSTLTPLETNVLKELNKNKSLIKSEVDKKVKQMANNSLQKTKGLSVNTKKNLNTIAKFGLQSASYLGTGVVYNKTYDYFDKKNQEDLFLKNLEKIRPMKDISDVTKLDQELANDY
jgi:hypothetical protein